MVAKQCKELIYVGPENLAALVAEIPGVSESRVPGQLAGDRFDVWCPLMSLTRWLGITLENMPAPKRYLTIPKQAIVTELQGDFKVGLSWAGSKTLKNDKKRSMNVSALKTLLGISGVSYFSLQMPLNKNEKEFLIQHEIQNLEPELPGYARTAALIDQMDLVITVDTAIGHVSAALGKPTWILLSDAPDWRWLESGSSTVWYPTVHLYRQTKQEVDYSVVLSTIKKDLISMIS